MSIPDVSEVGEPLEVGGHRVEVDEEATEEEDWNGGDWAEEDGHLQWRGSPDDEAERLSDERCLSAESEKHDETHEVVRLVGHPVNNAAVHDRKHDLLKRKTHDSVLGFIFEDVVLR